MKRTIFGTLLLGLLLGACGQSGPLYLPGNPSEVRTTPPPPAQSDSQEDDAERPEP